MSHDLSELRTKLRIMLNDENGILWSTNDIDRNLSLANFRLVKLLNLYEDWTIGSATIEILTEKESGKIISEYLLPTNLRRILRVYYIKDSKYIELTHEYTNTKVDLEDTTSDYATSYYIRGTIWLSNWLSNTPHQVIGFKPRPSLTGIKYYIEYIKDVYSLNEATSDGDYYYSITAIPDEFIELLLREAAMNCYLEKGLLGQYNLTKILRNEALHEFIICQPYRSTFAVLRPGHKEIMQWSLTDAAQR